MITKRTRVTCDSCNNRMSIDRALRQGPPYWLRLSCGVLKSGDDDVVHTNILENSK